VNEDEAAVVQAAFQLYRDCGSLKETAEGLNARGYRTKCYTAKNGTEHPGTPFRLNTVQYLLKNPAYLRKRSCIRRTRARL
jgi:hypothetical protein